MSELAALLEQATVKRAVIVDDAFDEVPIASDLALDRDNWTQFFEDLNDDDKKSLRSIFPRYDAMRADELPAVDEFVAALWGARATLRPEIIGPLFERFSRDKAADVAYLENLVTTLAASGLTCDKAGRAFEAVAVHADLIVIDLYLGPAQDELAIRASIEGLTRVIEQRRTRPPLVVLMSRSSRLEEKRVEFRDKSGLSESTFRIIKKAELAEAGRLNRLLARLASHYPDSIRLAAFQESWRSGVNRAVDRTARLIRTLDVADYAQIRQLLLGAEGEPLGSYLVDVFDRVLQHEVEREAAIIDAAIELNSLRGENYPPPYVTGSPDLQLLVFRSIFQNAERLRLMPADGSRVGFGDLLRRKPPGTAVAQPNGQPPEPKCPKPLAGTGALEVMAVLTPACDLQRKEAKGILLLNGTLCPLKPANWSYKESPIRTPIVEFADGTRFWIKWNIKHIATITHDELELILAEPDGVDVVARLRESHALELQQQLLSSLGRVGLLAQMPGTFPMKVEAYLPGLDRKLFRLDGPGLDAIQGVCFVGRNGESDMRLVLCEDDCESICRAIQGVDLAVVHADAHTPVQSLRAGNELLTALERGIVLPSPAQQTAKEIKVKSIGPGGAQTERMIGFIRRGEPLPLSGKDLTPGDVKKTGVYLAVLDQETVA